VTNENNLRDEFAMHAMAAIIAKTPLSIDEDAMVGITIMTARGAFNYADAMMNNRSGNDAPHGWVYNGPDGEWYWSEDQDDHESVTDQRPATALEKTMLTQIKDRS